MIRKAIKVLTLCLLVAFMSSCQTQEEKVISKLQTLAERIENKSDSFTDTEWESIYGEFESLQTQAKECDFTVEQLKAVAAAEAEVTAAIAKQKAKEVGNDINGMINEGKEVLEGIFDGIKEGFNGSDQTSEDTK